MTQTARFQDKIALVTGGGSGLGRSAAMRLAQEGAAVVVVDIDPLTAYQTMTEIQRMGFNALALEVDVSNFSECEEMTRTVRAQYGRLDVLFANAGIGGGGLTLLEMTEQQWERVIEVNLNSIFYTCKAAVPLMTEHGGAIVTTASSMAGWDTSLGGAAYMASKAGIVALTKSLALQLAGYRVRVNAVCPGIIMTNLSRRPGTTQQEFDEGYEKFASRIPLRRVGQPEDVASAVAFLASDDARHITGSALLIDGGQTLQSWSNAPDDDTYPLYR